MGEIESLINNGVFMIYDGTGEERDRDFQIIVEWKFNSNEIQKWMETPS